MTSEHQDNGIAEALRKRLKVTFAGTYPGNPDFVIEGKITRHVHTTRNRRVARVVSWTVRIDNRPGDAILVDVSVGMKTRNYLSAPVPGYIRGYRSKPRALVAAIVKAVETNAMVCALNSQKVDYHREIIKKVGPALSESALTHTMHSHVDQANENWLDAIAPKCRISRHHPEVGEMVVLFDADRYVDDITTPLSQTMRLATVKETRKVVLPGGWQTYAKVVYEDDGSERLVRVDQNTNVVVDR